MLEERNGEEEEGTFFPLCMHGRGGGGGGRVVGIREKTEGGRDGHWGRGMVEAAVAGADSSSSFTSPKKARARQNRERGVWRRLWPGARWGGGKLKETLF